MKQKQYKYDAFISYRHCDLDKFVAENLHRILESYELPKEIKERLDSAYDSLDEGDLDKAKSILEELQSLAPKLPDLVRIRKFIEIKSRK